MSPAASCLSASLFVQGSTVNHGSLSQASLRLVLRRVLDVAYLDKRQQPVEMPSLALERDPERDHPVVDQLAGDDLAVLRGLLRLIEGGCRHLGVDVVVDGIEV